MGKRALEQTRSMRNTGGEELLPKSKDLKSCVCESYSFLFFFFLRIIAGRWLRFHFYFIFNYYLKFGKGGDEEVNFNVLVTQLLPNTTKITKPSLGRITKNVNSITKEVKVPKLSYIGSQIFLKT